MEFLVQMEVGPIDESQEVILRRREAERARELATAGVLRRLWRIPGQRANWAYGARRMLKRSTRQFVRCLCFRT